LNFKMKIRLNKLLELVKCRENA
jgi:hypothetical protein